MLKQPTAILSCQDIHKSFRSGEQVIPVLRGVNLTVPQGSTVSIRGESGSGKTTLLNILSGLERADQGSLLWNGDDISHYPLAKLAQRRARFVGLVFQAYYLIPELDALDNVLFAARLTGAPIRQARDLARHWLREVGLEHRLHSRPAQLSGGERQRVAVARALMNNPALVLADEPTGNLDERTAGSVMEILLKSCSSAGSALLLVTHSPVFAGLAATQLFLHNGSFATD